MDQVEGLKDRQSMQTKEIRNMKEKEKKAGRNIKEIQDKRSNFQITGTDE